jgi:hypothetical protein
MSRRFCSFFILLAALSAGALSALGQESEDDYRQPEEPSDEWVSQEIPPPVQKKGAAEEVAPGDEQPEGEPASPSDFPAENATILEPVTPPAPPPKIWSGNVELGLNGTEGNSETLSIRAGGKAVGKFAWATQTYESIFVQNTASGLTTARNAIADGRWEIPLWNPLWSYYAHGRLEYDEFKPFDLRVAGDTGLSHDWIKTDINAFQTRAGISTSREFGGAEDFWKPELAFGLEWRRTIDARQKITIKSDYFPTWDDFSDYRLNTQADWEFAIQPAWNLSLKLSAISRYDATPNGARPHDLNYSALVLWNY